jgi:hypothetical protein
MKFIGILILLIVDVAITYAGIHIQRYGWRKSEEPLTLAGGLIAFGAAIGCHMLGAVPAMLMGVTRNEMFVPFYLFGMGPAVIYGYLVIESASHRTSDALFGAGRSDRPVASDHSKARTLLHKGDIDGALHHFHQYFEADLENPKPLWEMVNVLTKHQRYPEAADVLREIVQHFRQDESEWARAGFRLADIYENQLSDRKAAEHILRSIVTRTPKSAFGHDAQERIQRMTEKG